MSLPQELDCSEQTAQKLDQQDDLHSFRQEFHIPHSTIYMDGNSLGLASRPAVQSVKSALRDWQGLGIHGWLQGNPPWFDLAEKLGAQLAELVGASPQEVVVTGSTTINLHQLMATFYRPKQGKDRVVADELNFPSDLYALESQLAARGKLPDDHLHLVQSEDGLTLQEEDIVAALDEEVALAVLPSVLYHSGQLLDIEKLTRAAHDRGILIGFDCSHSVGVIPHEFDKWGVDFAFWCTYKYLNGGPGSTAALYVNQKHFDKAPGLAGWWGNDKETQFELKQQFEPAAGAGAWQIGTPPILSTIALKGALEITLAAGIERLRAKSLALTEYLMYLIDNKLEPLGFSVGTPREDHRRGGHVALVHPELAVRVNQALKARRIVPDFRPPDIIRLAPIPLYNSFHEVWQVVDTIHRVVETEEYLKFEDRPDTVS